LLIQLLILLVSFIFLIVSSLFLELLIIATLQDEPLLLLVEFILLDLLILAEPFIFHILLTPTFIFPTLVVILIDYITIVTHSIHIYIILHCSILVILIIQIVLHLLVSQTSSSFFSSSSFINSYLFLHPFTLQNWVVIITIKYYQFSLVKGEAFQDNFVMELIIAQIDYFLIQYPQDHPSHLNHFHHCLNFSIILITLIFIPLFFEPLVTKNFIFQYFLFPCIYFMPTTIYQDHNYLLSCYLMDYRMDQNYFHCPLDLNSFTPVSYDLHYPYP
jgi:hypothetical protein